MRKPVLYVLTILSFILASCQGGEKKDDGSGFYSQLKEQNSGSDVRSAKGKIKFEYEEFNFGEVEEGEQVYAEYKFENTGKGPITILGTRALCSCTSVKYPKAPIEPGGRAAIYVNFDSRGRPDHQSKAITLDTDGTPPKVALLIKGFVRPKN